MSVKEFCGQLPDAKLGKNDKKWFPAWLRRYASTVETVEGKLSVTEAKVIAFSRSLLASDTPAWQRLQAVRAIEAYRNLVLQTGQPPLGHIRKKLSRLAAHDREDRPGVEDERHLIGQIDPHEPEIIQQMHKELRLHHKALTTERSYVGWVQRFIRHCKSADLEQFGEPQRETRTGLPCCRNVAGSRWPNRSNGYAVSIVAIWTQATEPFTYRMLWRESMPMRTASLAGSGCFLRDRCRKIRAWASGDDTM